jgi:hypothetical protein
MKTKPSAMWNWCAGIGLAQAVADLSEGFESGMPTSYTTGDVALGSGTWSFVNVIRGTTKYAGSYSCQIRSSTGAEARTPTLAGGVGTISFWVYSSTSTGGLQVNLSTDSGATWTPAAGSPFTGLGSSWVQQQITVDNASVNKVQFYRTGATISLDEVAITSYAGGPAAPSVTTVAASGIGTTTATANGNVTDDGGDTVTERGVVYKTTAGVAITDNPTAAAAGGKARTPSIFLAFRQPDLLFQGLCHQQRRHDAGGQRTELHHAGQRAGGPDGGQSHGDDPRRDGQRQRQSRFDGIRDPADERRQYLQANGSFGASAVWQTAATWGTTTATGLSPETEYSFQVKARNGANVETAFGTRPANRPRRRPPASGSIR